MLRIEVLPEIIKHRLCSVCRTGQSGRRRFDCPVVGDDITALLQEGKHADRLPRFKSEDKIRLTVSDHRGEDLLPVANADVAEDISAALRHPDRLGAHDFISLFHGCCREELGSQNGSLSSDTAQNNISDHLVTPPIAPVGQSCSQSPHPVQRESSIMTLPSSMMIPGQPISRMQRLHPMHFS